jgi:ArsR family transcriptional regulator, arsenate/arsenite/antimonite-responsive transcriptional repressor
MNHPGHEPGVTTVRARRSDTTQVTGAVLDVQSAERLAHLFKALAEPTRVRLLSLIAATQGGEACLCDLTGPVALSQPTVSHHMRLLVESGLVTREQRGKWAYYRVVADALANLAQALQPVASPVG